MVEGRGYFTKEEQRYFLKSIEKLKSEKYAQIHKAYERSYLTSNEKERLVLEDKASFSYPSVHDLKKKLYVQVIDLFDFTEFLPVRCTDGKKEERLCRCTAEAARISDLFMINSKGSKGTTILAYQKFVNEVF